MAVSEERGRGFEQLLLQLESNDSQNNNNRTRQRYLELNHFPLRATIYVNLNTDLPRLVGNIFFFRNSTKCLQNEPEICGHFCGSLCFITVFFVLK